MGKAENEEPKPVEEEASKQPVDAEEGTSDPKPAEDGASDDSNEDTPDKHGQPGIAKGKYDRDIAAKDAEIAKLRGQVGEAAKTEKGRRELEDKIAKLEGSLSDEKVAHVLEVAGCKNVKAAKALLDDYEGDTDKLKEACPYLFGKDKATGSTGFKPLGTTDSLDDKLDKAFGLKKK